MLINFATLRIIWWILLGTLLIGIAVMDGIDLGIAMLLHRVAKTDHERRIVLNTVGPVWEGNQIWLILGGGAIFAAWPTLYAVSFSGFYFAMLLLLLGLIIRPVGFKYRSKIDNKQWRSYWDLGLFLGGFLPALIFGVAMGNVLQGVPFHFDQTLRVFYTGSFWQLLNPFAMLCGFTSISMLTMHGSIYLCIKTEHDIQTRAINYAFGAAITTILLFAIGGYWINRYIPGYVLTSKLIYDGPSNPFYKQMIQISGIWFSNYLSYPYFLLAPIVGFLGAFTTILLVKLGFYRGAWLSSALSIAGIIATVGVSLFPVILPSSSDPQMSLLIWDSSSSQLTLFSMLIATVIFLPIIIMYTSWVYYIMRGKVTSQYIQENSDSVY